MQYKTISVEHYLYQNRSASFALNKKYEEIINKEAMEGWKLVGIHTLPIERRRGCIWWCLFMFWERLQVDLLIFYRETCLETLQTKCFCKADFTHISIEKYLLG